MFVAPTLAVLACMIWLVKIYWENRRFIRLALAIPSVKTGPFGIVGDLVGKSLDENVHNVLRLLGDEDGMVRKAWFGSFLMVGISKPEDYQVIMNSKNSLYRGHIVASFLKDLLGEGLLTAPVDIWKKNRKLLNPAFHMKLLNSFIPIFAAKCDIHIKILEKHVGIHDVDIRKILTRVSLDTISETTFGARVAAETNQRDIDEVIHKYLDIFMVRVSNVFYHYDTLFGLTKYGKQISRLVAEFDDFTKKAIFLGEIAFEKKRQGDYHAEQDDPKNKEFLEILLEESTKNSGFSDDQVRDEVKTLITTATDTTGLALSYCLLALGLHPEFQEKLYEEAKEVLGEERYATKEDLSKLNYTEMFIKETLRIFPIIPILVRQLSDDVAMDGVVIPKDAVLLLDVFNLHRNPKYWKDPLKFDPDRFSPENAAKQYPYSYVPFSRGPRDCIGSRYAMMFMKTVLSKIVRKFIVKTDYKSVEEVKLTMKLTSCPRNGFKVTLYARK